MEKLSKIDALERDKLLEQLVIELKDMFESMGGVLATEWRDGWQKIPPYRFGDVEVYTKITKKGITVKVVLPIAGKQTSKFVQAPSFPYWQLENDTPIHIPAESASSEALQDVARKIKELVEDGRRILAHTKEKLTPTVQSDTQKDNEQAHAVIQDFRDAIRNIKGYPFLIGSSVMADSIADNLTYSLTCKVLALPFAVSVIKNHRMLIKALVDKVNVVGNFFFDE